MREVELGASVRQGEVIGRIVSGRGEVISVLTSPEDGILGAVRLHAGVEPGDGIATVWIPTHARAGAYEAQTAWSG